MTVRQLYPPLMLRKNFVGVRLQHRMMEQGISPEKLVTLLRKHGHRKSIPTIYNWLSERHAPSESSVFLLAKILDVPTVYFFNPIH